MADDIKPFEIHIPDVDIELTRKKLELARFPRELSLEVDQKWEYGAPEQNVRDLVDYWKSNFDWRKQEAEINAELPQFTTPIDTEEDGFGILNIHFVWKKSTCKNAIPLIFIHGWPGSFLEVKKILGPLTEPSDPSHPAFDVVAPSLPGFAFSDGPRKPGLSILSSAKIFHKLMQKLGYKHYVVQGGDWGAIVARGIAIQFQEACRGIHVNMLVIPPSPISTPLKFVKLILSIISNGYLPGGYSKLEIDRVLHIQKNLDQIAGYHKIQASKPQTLSYGLVDSPVGVLGWIYEKLHVWTDNYPWTPDEILTWISLYWYTDTASTLRYYKEFEKENQKLFYSWSNVPLAYTQFPVELYNFPNDMGSTVQPLKFFRAHDSGGHFAAWEKPEVLVGDVREFYGPLQLSDSKL